MVAQLTERGERMAQNNARTRAEGDDRRSPPLRVFLDHFRRRVPDAPPEALDIAEEAHACGYLVRCAVDRWHHYLAEVAAANAEAIDDETACAAQTPVGLTIGELRHAFSGMTLNDGMVRRILDHAGRTWFVAGWARDDTPDGPERFILRELVAPSKWEGREIESYGCRAHGLRRTPQNADLVGVSVAGPDGRRYVIGARTMTVGSS